MSLIAPYGGTLVNRIADSTTVSALEDLARTIPSLRLQAWEAADLDMIGSGALSPLTGFMTGKDYRSVLTHMRLESGLPWTIPVTIRSHDAPIAEQLALRNEAGHLLAILDVTDRFRADPEDEARIVYGTTDAAHPGVARLHAAGSTVIGGDVWIIRRASPEFPELSLDPSQTRRLFEQRGWRTVVGFQTRNPVHRAHEYIQKAALETVDGLLLHPLVGTTRGEDIPATVRVESYRILLRRYYAEHHVLLAAFPAAMRYAGPREAVFHAIARRNYGCSHFIVGRDHAGVGNYYGTYDAQRIFDRFSQEELGVRVVPFEHTFYCNVCGGMASRKTCPHPPERHVALSGTRVRELLQAGKPLPLEFSRPEVARVLGEWYTQMLAAGAD